MRGRCRCCGQVVDGFGDHAVQLDISPIDREALSAWRLHADAHDGGDTGPCFVAVNRQVDGLLKAQVESDRSSGAHQLEHLLFVFYLKGAIAAACVRYSQRLR